MKVLRTLLLVVLVGITLPLDLIGALCLSVYVLIVGIRDDWSLCDYKYVWGKYIEGVKLRKPMYEQFIKYGTFEV